MDYNFILDTDSYKPSHYLQYPQGITNVFSYLESRGGRFPSTLFFGLQYILKNYFTTPVTKEDVLEAEKFLKEHGEPFNTEGWMYIVQNLNGQLPLKIKAVPEGTLVPNHNVLMTVENTDPKCFWLTSYVETQLMRIWYPITVATQSYYIKKLIFSFLEKTSDEPEKQIPFKLHDFGARGVSSRESASIGGASHLVNFMGTDTIVGILCANKFYQAGMAGYSIPAAEHSSITSWGKDQETEAYQNMLQQFAKPGALVAVVSDSYDINYAVDHIWGESLRDQVINSGATIIIRPDSGDPVSVVARTIESLATNFGYYINNKGFKVLKYVKVIQGDGVNENSIRQILEKLTEMEFSTDNIAFGMGGRLLQAGIDRDTNKFAYKCSSIVVNGQERDVFKDPISDPGKRSKAGRLNLITTPTGEFRTVNYESQDTALEIIYLNGVLIKEHTFKEIRERAQI